MRKRERERVKEKFVGIVFFCKVSFCVIVDLLLYNHKNREKKKRLFKREDFLKQE
jgi:hypothetical protein